MAGIYKYITPELPEITECDKNVIAYNVEIIGETETEILQFDAKELWKAGQQIYNGDTQISGTDSTQLLCKVTDKQGNVFIITASKCEELKAPQIIGNTKHYFWRIYFVNLSYNSGAKNVGWRDFIKNYITEDNIYSIVLNGIANNQIQFSTTLTYNSTPIYNIGYNGGIYQATKIDNTDNAECNITFTYTLPNNNLYDQIGNATQILAYFAYTNYQQPGALIDSYNIVSDINNNGIHTIVLNTIFSNTTYYYNNINAFRVYLSLLADKNDYTNEWWRLITDEKQGVTILEPIVSIPIITLPTITQYNKGNITLQTNIAIVTSNETEQAKIENNTANIVYTLTNVNNETNVYTGVGVWNSKNTIINEEQGTMNNNIINVSFSDVAIGNYIYKIEYIYSDGNTYTEEENINIISLPLSYFGININRYGFVLNIPITYSIKATTGASQGQKPTYMKMVFTNTYTGQQMKKYVYIHPYNAKIFFDLRQILPSYFDVNNKEYTINIDSILYNDDLEEYENTQDTLIVLVSNSSNYINIPIWQYGYVCNDVATTILPQFLKALDGYNTKLWITFLTNNQKLYINNNLIYQTSEIGRWGDTQIFDFTEVTEEDVLRLYAIWWDVGENKPLIPIAGERVMIKFDAPENVEMPEFAMLLDDIHTEPTLIDSYEQTTQLYNTITNMYNCIEKVILSIPMLTNSSIYYYNILFANQNIIKVSNGNEWQKYQITKIQTQQATEGYNNGKFTIELENVLTTKKYIQW